MRVKVAIDQELFMRYRDIRLGCIQFDATVQESRPKFWDYVENDVIPDIRKSLESKEWNQIPGVKSSRLAYKAFGRNPGRYRVSSEALLRRIRRLDPLYRINTVVDVNNLISIQSGLSVGSYDMEQIKGDVLLRKAGAQEGYTGIGKSFIDMENMLVLADQEGIFGSSLSDSIRTMVTMQSQHILSVIYCFEEELDLLSLLDKSRLLLEEYAGAKNVETWIV